MFYISSSIIISFSKRIWYSAVFALNGHPGWKLVTFFFSSVDLRMGQKHMDIHDFAGDSCARPNVIGWMLKGTICKKLW